MGTRDRLGQSLLLGLALLFNGCVMYTMIQQVITAKSENVVLENERGYISTRAKQPIVTKEDVLRTWGSPDMTRTDGNTEILTYQREWGFSGPFVLIGIVPIPLMVPVGYRHTSMYFTDGRFTKVEQEAGGSSSSWFCGFEWEIQPFSCGSR